VELRRYLQIVGKWLWLIGLGTLLAAAVSYGVSSVIPPVYRVSTSLLIRTGEGSGDDYGTVIANQYLAATYSELLTKRPIVEEAAINLGLRPLTVEELMEQLEVWVVPNTSVIRLTVEDEDPRLATELANEIVSVFVQSQRESGSGRGRDIYVVEPATYPLEPAAPRILFNTLVATIGGCVLAVAIAFLIEYLDDTLGTAEDINQNLSLPALVAIPPLNRRQRRNKIPVTVSDPTSLPAEAYRALYATIQFSNGHSPITNKPDVAGTIVITSPSSREEKAHIAVNLGTAIAQAGFKVLLVDADLRRPQLHRAFGLTNEAGLSNLLAGNDDPQKYIARTEVSNLWVLPSGPPSKSSMLLSSKQVFQLIDELGRHADIVLFEAPPVLTSTDAVVLSSQVERTLLAIESGSTQREVATQAIERLRSVHANMLGVVLNKARS
jgi:succinoglycan biosynthesis transport protein ExoP